MEKTIPKPKLIENIDVRCLKCGYIGHPKNGRNPVTKVLAVILVFLFWPLTAAYFLMTSRYLCPQCGAREIERKLKNGNYIKQKYSSIWAILFVLAIIGAIALFASIMLSSI